MSDDDVRVEFGRAHDYACMIAEQENGLELLTSLLTGKCHIGVGSRAILSPIRHFYVSTPRRDLTPWKLSGKFIDYFLEFQTEKTVISELLPTLSRLAVRNEFCQKIVELGGLEFVMDVLAKYYEDKELVESSFFLIKSLAGNDDVKREVSKGNAVPLIAAALGRHKVQSI